MLSEVGFERRSGADQVFRPGTGFKALFGLCHRGERFFSNFQTRARLSAMSLNFYFSEARTSVNEFLFS